MIAFGGNYQAWMSSLGLDSPFRQLEYRYDGGYQHHQTHLFPPVLSDTFFFSFAAKQLDDRDVSSALNHVST